MTIQTIDCKNAAEFIQTLRPSNPRWLQKTDWKCHWIFRGQSADWPLLPSAWREKARDEELYQTVARWDHDSSVDEILKDSSLQAFGLSEHLDNARLLVIQNRFEFHAVRAFADLVDDLGLEIPGGTLPKRRSFAPLSWVNLDPPLHPTVGLAQHHGMPTRLLDWTHNPLKAAFFAADRAEPNTPGRIIVWAANRLVLAQCNHSEFTVQRSQIGYLHAQEGLFTYPELTNAEYQFVQSGKWPTLEESVSHDGLCKVTLANSEIPELTRLLWSERITKAHLMPTLDNVNAALRTAWRISLEATRSKS